MSEDSRISYEKAARDLKRYLPLKIATFIWFIAILTIGVYLIAATWNEWWPFPQLHIHDFETTKPAIYSFAAGLLGSAIYALRGFYWAIGPQSATERRYQYDPNWTWWYVSRPIMGAVLGIFTFAILRAGVGTFGADSTAGGGQSTSAYFAVSFLAGFSVTEFLSWATAHAQRLFSPVPHSRTSDTNEGGTSPSGESSESDASL